MEVPFYYKFRQVWTSLDQLGTSLDKFVQVQTNLYKFKLECHSNKMCFELIRAYLLTHLSERYRSNSLSISLQEEDSTNETESLGKTSSNNNLEP